MLCRKNQRRKRIKPSEDISGICILMILYILQGIPIGLSASIPFMLQSSYYTGSYQAQATFSLVFWPFSFKLVWAPIIDSIYSTHIGRRKTWLIPTQYAIGIELIILANYINNWLGRDPNNPWSPLGTHHPVDIISLTVAFFGLTFLAATQDIAVDGWAISVLSKKNLGWASTCNVVGQTIGYVTAFILFLCLESPSISNNYLRWTPIEGEGLITFSGFLYFWGVTFMVTNTLLVLFKHEKGSKLDTEFRKCLNYVIGKLYKRLTLSNSSESRNHNHTNNDSINHDVDNIQDSSVVRSFNSEDIHDENSNIDDSKVPLKSKDHIQSNNQCFQENKLINNTSTDLELICRTNQILHNETSHQINSIKTKPNNVNEYLTEILQTTNTNDINQNNETHKNTVNNTNNQRVDRDQQEIDLSLIDTYRVMFGVIRLKPVWQFLILLTTVKISLAAPETIFSLKLIENGFPKERLALFGVLLLPIQAILPLLITRWTNGPRPLGVFIIAFLPRLLITSLTIPIVYYTPYFRIIPPNHVQFIHLNKSDLNNSSNSNNNNNNNFIDISNSTHYTTTNIKKDITYSFTWLFYVLLLSKLFIHSIISSIMMVVQVAFHAKISDPTVGGTYMTLLNTVSNIAGSLPSTALLSLIEPLTKRQCILKEFNQTIIQSIHSNNLLLLNYTNTTTTANTAITDNNTNHYNNSYSLFNEDKIVQEYNATCKPPHGIKACESLNGTCITQLDGFYLEVGLSVIFGLIVYPFLLYPMANRLDSLPSSAYSFKLTTVGCCSREKQRNIVVNENETEYSQLSS
ncbi:Acetyl-coenzyme A transporter 1 isoform 2 [Schistosoma japonicum]|uniref:Acetyl-coenzyme A transporter 1 isoform 2 n=3 Tax=Schistosoma japonicum TaxID=6182 RepID=A0A4Z2D331_SCHJA|nr:Acetyl-coenzyme A transporter 1 isoform 2 [Schistosoma japonicum]